MDELTREAERDRLVNEWNALVPDYDGFPTTVQLVVDPCPIVDVAHALFIGRHVGFNSITRHINPTKVALVGLDEMFRGPGRVTTFIARPVPVGTAQHGENHNFLLVTRYYNAVYQAEIGCFHNMELTATANCWRQWTCSKCSWGYEIDSGD